MPSTKSLGEKARALFLGFLAFLATTTAAWGLSLGLPVILAYLQSQDADWASLALFAVAGFGIALMILASARVILRYETREELATSANVERLALGWANRLGYSIKRKDPNEKQLFCYRFTVNDAIHVLVAKPLDRELLEFAGRVATTEDQRKFFTALPPDQRERTVLRFVTELAKLGAGYNVDLPNYVVIETQVPITAELTDDRFQEKVRAVCNGIALAVALVRMDLGFTSQDPRVEDGA